MTKSFDLTCEENFVRTTTRDDNGRYLFIFYLFIYILALQVHTYNYRASHIELIFYIIIIFKL